MDDNRTDAALPGPLPTGEEAAVVRGAERPHTAELMRILRAVSSPTAAPLAEELIGMIEGGAEDEHIRLLNNRAVALSARFSLAHHDPLEYEITETTYRDLRRVAAAASVVLGLRRLRRMRIRRDTMNTGWTVSEILRSAEEVDADFAAGLESVLDAEERAYNPYE